jgi:hypothetical protein
MLVRRGLKTERNVLVRMKRGARAGETQEVPESRGRELVECGAAEEVFPDDPTPRPGLVAAGPGPRDERKGSSKKRKAKG